jgi:hypothetical protein
LREEGSCARQLFPQRPSDRSERLSSRLREEGSCARRRRAEVGGRGPPGWERQQRWREPSLPGSYVVRARLRWWEGVLVTFILL